MRYNILYNIYIPVVVCNVSHETYVPRKGWRLWAPCLPPLSPSSSPPDRELRHTPLSDDTGLQHDAKVRGQRHKTKTQQIRGD